MWCAYTPPTAHRSGASGVRDCRPASRSATSLALHRPADGWYTCGRPLAKGPPRRAEARAGRALQTRPAFRCVSAQPALRTRSADHVTHGACDPQPTLVGCRSLPAEIHTLWRTTKLRCELTCSLHGQLRVLLWVGAQLVYEQIVYSPDEAFAVAGELKMAYAG